MLALSAYQMISLYATIEAEQNEGESKVLFFLLVLIKGMSSRSESKISLYNPRGLGASLQSFHKRGGRT